MHVSFHQLLTAMAEPEPPRLPAEDGSHLLVAVPDALIALDIKALLRLGGIAQTTSVTTRVAFEMALAQGDYSAAIVDDLMLTEPFCEDLGRIGLRLPRIIVLSADSAEAAAMSAQAAVLLKPVNADALLGLIRPLKRPGP